jgi:hypothetical protein
MFDELKQYLLLTRLSLIESDGGEGGVHLEIMMEEISKIAVSNWVNRGDDTPDLTLDQVDKVVTRVLARTYNKN